MRILVCDSSKTGFTRRYAVWTAQALGAERMDFSEVTPEKMAKFDTIIYGGGLYEGKVNGLKQARNMFLESGARRLILFATGATPNAAEDAVKKQWAYNLRGEEIPHVYMQAGLCYEKMPLPDKLLMKLFAGFLEREQEKSPERAAFQHSMKASFDITDRNFILPLLRLAKEE